MQVRKRFVIAAAVILACTAAAIVFFGHCFVFPSSMDRLVIHYENGDEVIALGECNIDYRFDKLLRKDVPSDGTLYMKNGKTFEAPVDRYGDYAVTIVEKYGYYVIKERYL